MSPIAEIDEELCMGCKTCEWNCPFNGIEVQSTDAGPRATVDKSACKGCGICWANCPRRAISAKYFTDSEVVERITNMSENLLEKEV